MGFNSGFKGLIEVQRLAVVVIVTGCRGVQETENFWTS